MSEQKPTFNITIITDVRRNLIYFKENNGTSGSCLISDLPEPLLHLLAALDEGKRMEIILAEAVYETTVMLAKVVDK